MSKGIGIIVIVALIIALVIFGPFATIWAANTLFPALVIPYTFQTWIAVVVLGMFLKGNVTVKK